MPVMPDKKPGGNPCYVITSQPPPSLVTMPVMPDWNPGGYSCHVSTSQAPPSHVTMPGRLSLTGKIKLLSSSLTWGVFLVTTTSAIVTIKRGYSVNTYSGISTVPQGSEQSVGPSP